MQRKLSIAASDFFSFFIVRANCKNIIKSVLKYTYQFQIDPFLIERFSCGLFCSVQNYIHLKNILKTKIDVKGIKLITHLKRMQILY